jgi:hypothetical protein
MQRNNKTPATTAAATTATVATSPTALSEPLTTDFQQATPLSTIAKPVVINHLSSFFDREDWNILFRTSKGMRLCSTEFFKTSKAYWREKLIHDFDCHPKLANLLQDPKKIHERLSGFEYSCSNKWGDSLQYNGEWIAQIVKNNKPCPPLFDLIFDKEAFEKSPNRANDRYWGKSRDLVALIKIACAFGNISYVKSLFALNSDIEEDISTQQSDTLLFHTLASGNLELVQWLLDTYKSESDIFLVPISQQKYTCKYRLYLYYNEKKGLYYQYCDGMRMESVEVTFSDTELPKSQRDLIINLFTKHNYNKGILQNNLVNAEAKKACKTLLAAAAKKNHVQTPLELLCAFTPENGHGAGRFYLSQTIVSGNKQLLNWFLEHINSKIETLYDSYYGQSAALGDNVELLRNIIEQDQANSKPLLQEWCNRAAEYGKINVIKFFHTEHNILPEMKHCLSSGNLELSKYVVAACGIENIQRQLRYTLSDRDLNTLTITKYVIHELGITPSIAGYNDCPTSVKYAIRHILVNDFGCDKKVVASIKDPMKVYNAIIKICKKNHREITLSFKKEKDQLEFITEVSTTDPKNHFISVKFTPTANYVLNDLLHSESRGLSTKLNNTEVLQQAIIEFGNKLTPKILQYWSNQAASNHQFAIVKWLHKNKSILPSITSLGCQQLELIKYVIENTPDSTEKRKNLESRFSRIDMFGYSIEIAEYVVNTLGLKLEFTVQSYQTQTLRAWYLDYLEKNTILEERTKQPSP